MVSLGALGLTALLTLTLNIPIPGLGDFVIGRGANAAASVRAQSHSATAPGNAHEVVGLEHSSATKIQ